MQKIPRFPNIEEVMKMLWYWMALLVGAAALWLMYKYSDAEMNMREAHYRKLLHSAFVMCDIDLEAVLYRSYYVVGRRRRRCDLCLDQLKDKSISKVHAILWYDSTRGCFCIGPAKNWKWGRGVYYPEIYVNGEKVPVFGKVLSYGDDIRMGCSQFTLAYKKG